MFKQFQIPDHGGSSVALGAASAMAPTDACNNAPLDLFNSLPGASPREMKSDAPALAEAVDAMGVRLAARQYAEACLDLAKADVSALVSRKDDSALPRGNAAIKNIGVRRSAPRALSLREEMPHAVRAYDYLAACVRRLMASAGNGMLDTGSVAPAIEGLIGSLERNPDALLCLPRMRQRDAYIYTHSVNVSVLLAAFAMQAGGDHTKIATYALAGLFHDLGKALLPVSLLNARRKLGPTEQTLVTRHPMLGCDLLAVLPDLRSEVLLATLEHHERYDGSGYPKGLYGDAISEMGHLTGIADTYDALSSRRPYKGSLFPHRTLGVMYQMRKKQFHPVLMEKFVRLVGIYPVGSVVELKDGYRGVVTAGNYANPMQPVVTLALDPGGNSMRQHECDLARDGVAAIARCLPPELSGIDPCHALGLAL
ncbi:HD-GYP domain-containing protein [Desulfovibrio sp. OttesenSCG-928-F20]|nr:HD-GYP domain-containing protein [Desulfovibrio sp. OttesenSCG-928-F20]